MSNRATVIGKCRAKTGLLHRSKYAPSFLAIHFGDQLAFLSFPATARVRALSARNSIKALARAIIASFLPPLRWLFLVIDLTLKVTERKNERETPKENPEWERGGGSMGRMGRFYESRVGRKLIHCRPRCDCAMGRRTCDVGSWRLGKNTQLCFCT